MTATSAPPEQYVSRVRRLPVPVTEPPFDDELGIVLPRGEPWPLGGAPAPGTPIQGTLPLGLEPDAAFDDQLRPIIAGEPAVTDSLWLRYPGPEPHAATPGPPLARASVPAPTSARRRRASSDADELPDPRRWTARLARSALECLHGRRPVQQLVRWTAEPVYRELTRRAGAPEAAPAERPRIRALRVCRVTASVAEASVVVQLGRATRAVAVRLEADDGRWLCTAFDLVEPNPARRTNRRSNRAAARGLGRPGVPGAARGQREAQASSNATA
ncbi:hypothetical protein E1262_00715 [Jiangella aurantiaca]|uniref:Uncharacterized protein n=1 Tax=Jiangella aurantiaca TaxID=2530373 RepID=A0A4R5APS0_9ACTN|nr:Rv3235 family protein [Jiangella aurantiaca]TDD73044.1 hypothetical protein E1262_00715 [Jiangella aurantiaca]